MPRRQSVKSMWYPYIGIEPCATTYKLLSHLGFICTWGKFLQRSQYWEKCENYPHVKISTFTVRFVHLGKLWRFCFSSNQSNNIAMPLGSNILQQKWSVKILYARLQSGRIMVWWCPSVRVSVRLSVRPSLRPTDSPSVRPGLRPPVFHTFFIHALTYWAEILHITLF